MYTKRYTRLSLLNPVSFLCVQPGEGNRSFASLLGFLCSAIETFPEVRTGNNTTYSIEDIALSAFSDRLIRRTLPRRKDFFNDIRALSRYICFESWEQLLAFMILGLELPDPGG